MIRLGALFWVVLVSTVAFAMFGVKYQVQALEDDLSRTNRAIMAEEHEVRVLDAEWAYLTRPETLEGMNRQFLSLAPISTKQLHTAVTDLPMRPPPPPPPPAPVEAPIAVAAAEPPSLPSPPSPPPSATEGVPVRDAAQATIRASVEAASIKSALRAMPALLEKPAPTSAPILGKALPVKAVAKSSPPRRAKSLDDLIAQIMTSR